MRVFLLVYKIFISIYTPYKCAEEQRSIVEEQLCRYEESLLRDQQKQVEAQMVKESIQVHFKKNVYYNNFLISCFPVRRCKRHMPK
jgi:hypothetical protein